MVLVFAKDLLQCFCCRGPQGGLAQKLKRENNEPGTTRAKKRKAKKRKIGDDKVKVASTMESHIPDNEPGVAPCPQPEPPVDLMELLLSERVYHEEDQGVALNNLYEEMFRKTVAHNEAVIKNLQ